MSRSLGVHLIDTRPYSNPLQPSTHFLLCFHESVPGGSSHRYQPLLQCLLIASYLRSTQTPSQVHTTLATKPVFFVYCKLKHFNDHTLNLLSPYCVRLAYTIVPVPLLLAMVKVLSFYIYTIQAQTPFYNTYTTIPF